MSYRTSAICGVVFVGAALLARAETFVISTEVTDIPIDVPHLGPEGGLVKTPRLATPTFRPPSIFSAPLPSGSGARALGLAGAFTAVADDATAASWNPGGLTQLEAPEVSLVLRASRDEQRHRTEEGGLRVGEDETSDEGLNYLSAVYPFQLGGRNCVASMNLQEAYDFRRSFHSRWTERQSSTNRAARSATYADEDNERVYGDNGYSYIDVSWRWHTTQATVLSQVLDSGLASDVDFEQDGVIYATTPALAMELSPRFSAGAALNFYHDDPFDGGGVHSLTTARYRGASDGNTRIADTRTTSGDYTYTGLSIRPPTGSSPLWRTNAIAPGAGEIPAFTDRTPSTAHTGTRVAGEYREENQFDGFTGINATLGALWNVNERLTLGGSVDLPWSADATQTKTLRSRSRTRDLRGRVIDEEDTTERASSDVTFDFPLRAALGMAVRWSDAFTTSLDAEYTRWSDFAFQAGDGPRINPLDGTAHGEHAIEDCWSVRAGAEYLLILRRTEIPFRVGVGREERPAIGRPDEIWQLSAGTGFAFGRGPGRTIVDLAYQYSRGRDVMGSLVPGREVTTDVDEHEGYLSCIRHF